MNKNILSQYFDFKRYGQKWSPNNFMQSLSAFYCFLMTKNNITFKLIFTFKPWLLNFFDLRSYGSKLRKRYTLRLFLMCLEERSFRSCSVWGNGGQMTRFGERCAWGELEVGETLQINYKMSFIKDSLWRVCRHFMSTSHWPFLGHYILNRTTKNAYKKYLNMSAKLP